MKKHTLLAMALVLVSSPVALAGVHIVGGGTPNIEDTNPFFAYRAACRWQTMWFRSELDEKGPITKIEWQNTDKIAGYGGTFFNCDILLCHTNAKWLDSTFATNYGGNTPVNVFKGTYVLPTSALNQWITIVEPKNFTFNNKDNLLMEVSWQGATGGGTFFKIRTSGSGPYPGRVWNRTSKAATTGIAAPIYHHYGRITIGYVGVEPTSLGRVKSIFK